MTSPFVLPIRGPERSDPERDVLPHLHLDCLRHVAVFAGKAVTLSTHEFALLQLLAVNAGKALTRDRILNEVWADGRSSNLVDVYINYLRRKLAPTLIRTVRGVGYELVLPEPLHASAPEPVVADRADPLPGMIGDSLAMQPVYRLARRVAAHNVPVLVTGPTGAGKELVARAIHALSRRVSQPMISINCAAIPDALMESELFGFTRGAFTGAVQSHLGRIHAAQGGTLFLDEVGEVPLAMQAKLLRFLESGELQRLGSRDVFQMDVRVIAASNADLARRVREGSFRDDLYYRLAVFPIALPPLADRDDDVLLLARHFLGRSGLALTAAAEARLRRHDWRGNVRELRHVIERALILASPGRILDAVHIAL